MVNTSGSLRFAPAFLFLLSACGGGGGNGGNVGVPGNPPPAAIQTQQVFAGVNLASATALTQAPNDPARWFALNQAGVVTVFDNDTVNAVGSTFLDIDLRVDSGPNEAGLLGIAFHPDFANNGEVFISYTAGSPFRSVISRFRSLDGNQTLDPATEEVLLTITQPAGNHNGGNLAFGPTDGFLYIGFGDGGGAAARANSRNVTNLHGSILRINVNTQMGYTIPPDNPFFANAANPCTLGFGGGSCPEIFAWGFRNPWRFSLDRSTNQLWVGDVGETSWEEVDRVNNGEDYGWDVREGAHCFNPSSGCPTAGLTDPVTEYGRNQGNSITGGYVYRGTAIPALVGQYVFGDFGSGRIFAVAANAPLGTPPVELADTAFNISAFAEGVDGELYVVHYGGAIHQIVP